MTMAPGDPPLTGLRVLDLTQFLSGPYCTQMLADMGAEVIKLESPEGDLARHIPPYFVGDDSFYYLSINRTKQSVAADLKSAQGREVALKLIAASDVVVENFRPGVLKKLGLDPEAILKADPRLIWCSISGFGQDGPYRDKPAYDMIVQALSGGMSLTGEPGRSAVRAGVPIGDLAAGMYGAVALLAALHRREKTGLGDWIDISMLDCQIAMQTYQAAYHLHSGVVPGRQGAAHDSIATYRAFDTGDGLAVAVCANTERMWRGLCAALELEALADDARFATNADRYRARETLWPLLEAAFLARTADACVAALEREQVPVAAVNPFDRAFTDPQVIQRGMVMELAGQGETIRVAGDPIRFAQAGRPDPTFPPSLGKDTRRVLHEVLGLDDDAIADLIAGRAVVQKIDAGA